MRVSKLSEVPRQSMSRATKFFYGAEHVSRQGLTDESKEVSVNVIHFDREPTPECTSMAAIRFCS